MLSSLIRKFPVVVTILLASCSGNADKATNTTISEDTATTMASAEVINNGIVNGTQDMLLARHRVASFSKWKTSYDEHDSLRLANALHNYVIGRGVDDSNMILVALKTDDMARARAFSQDQHLKDAMKKGGVVGAPMITMVRATWQDTSHISSVMRSMTSFSVKNWTSWLNAFNEGTQERADNGITARVIGHDAEDSNKVILVAAILDSAKAAAFWKSDMLKKRRAASGVTGEVERFVFRVVQRY